MNKIAKVSFTECGSRKKTWSTGINTDSLKKSIEFDSSIHNMDEEILDVAVKKLFGKTCFWFGNVELGKFEYGQVFKPMKNDSASASVTNRVFVEIK